jgi:glucosamine--fructose-6-phosphate aminotransferase (isomerizing)
MLHMPNFHTYREIRTQAAAWQDALRTVNAHQDIIQRMWKEGRYDYVLFTGCGSTYYLSLIAASFAQENLKVLSRGVPASELLLHPQGVYFPNMRPLLVTVSRSAATTETIQAAQDFRAIYGDHIIAISCYDDQPLNSEAALNLSIPAAQEISLAQTRSFSSMLVAAEAMIRVLARLDLNIQGLGDEAFVQKAHEEAERLADLERFDRYFYLGSGPRYGLACEAMLKMKEMSQTYAEAYHPMEFRHGPKSMVNERTLVIGLLDESGYEYERAVLEEMASLGATTVNVSARPDADFRISESAETPLVRYLPLMQWMAYHRAINKALNPDQPHNLDMVVHL